MSAKKPNILLLFDWFYPDYSAGGPVRSCINLIEQTKNDINWFVLTSNETYQSKQVNNDLPVKTWERLPFGGKVMYVSPHENRTFLKQILTERVWKTVYVNSMYSAFFGFQAVSMAKQLKLRTIVCPRGMLAKGSVKQKWWLKIPFLKASKALGWFSNVEWHATNSEEELSIKKWYKPQRKTTVLPNLVGKQNRGVRSVETTKQSLKILCVARISPEKNIHYLIERLGSLGHKNIELTIIGGIHNQTYAEQLKKLSNDNQVNVDWKGHMDPKDIEKSLLNYDLFVLPTLGENFGHAVVEALRIGLPVLISDLTPWQNLTDTKAGYALDLANKEAFEQAITTFYEMDETEWLPWHEGAKKCFKTQVVQANLPNQYIKLFTQKS